jgi:hypothetical protein
MIDFLRQAPRKVKKVRCNRESNMWSRKAPQQGCAHRRVLDDLSQLDHYATLRGKCAVADGLDRMPTMGTYIPYLIFAITRSICRGARAVARDTALWQQAGTAPSSWSVDGQLPQNTAHHRLQSTTSPPIHGSGFVRVKDMTETWDVVGAESLASPNILVPGRRDSVKLASSMPDENLPLLFS